MDADKYFRSKIEFKEETNTYLKSALCYLDNNRSLTLPNHNGKIEPHYFDGKLIKDVNELKGCLLAFESYVNKPFELSIKSIKKIHTTAFKYSTGSKRKGRFVDSGNNMIFPLKAGGAIEIETSLPGDVNSHMNRLINWTNTQLSKKEIHPIIVIALFKYEYVSIHPFDNGNGRTSRILLALLLKMAGYNFIPYLILEKAINDNRHPYYGSLVNAQLQRGSNMEKIDAWILYLVSGLMHLIKQCNKPN